MRCAPAAIHDALAEAHQALVDTPTGSNAFGWKVPTTDDYDRVAAALDRLADAVGAAPEVEWCVEHDSPRVDDDFDKCWVRLAAWDKVSCRFACAFVVAQVIA